MFVKENNVKRAASIFTGTSVNNAYTNVNIIIPQRMFTTTSKLLQLLYTLINNNADIYEATSFYFFSNFNANYTPML